LSLYKKRWGIETMYGRLKEVIHIEKFHAKTYNGVMQEIFAHLLVISLTALIEYQASMELKLDREKVVPSFKAAIGVVKRHLIIIIGSQTTISSEEAIEWAEHMVAEAGQVLWKKQPGRRCPRVSKQSIKPWNLCKKKKLEAFKNKRKA
jgi:hypothetical protein